MSKARSGPRVLVVEDDPANRELVCAALTAAGYATHAVEDGEDALAACAALAFDGVVLDVQLPGISGYEVCRSLKEKDPRLPVVFVSGSRREAMDRVAGLLLGADDYVTKPFAPDELAARLRALVRKRAANGTEPAVKLTDRELDVLRLLAAGRPKSEIAAELVISHSTVATHMEHIFAKLRARNGAHAVSEAYRLELL